MHYHSSRGKSPAVTAAETIVAGIAPDGGLFVPETIPPLKSDFTTTMGQMSYQQKAAAILKLYLTDFTAEEISKLIDQAYNKEKFDHTAIAPLVRIGEGLHIQELWHVPTSSFKDMALQLLPHLMMASAARTGEKREIVILVDT